MLLGFVEEALVLTDTTSGTNIMHGTGLARFNINIKVSIVGVYIFEPTTLQNLDRSRILETAFFSLEG